MPRNYRNMRKYWTNEWFLKNRIVIKAVTKYAGKHIKEKCREMGIMFFYGGHITSCIRCVGRYRTIHQCGYRDMLGLIGSKTLKLNPNTNTYT